MQEEKERKNFVVALVDQDIIDTRINIMTTTYSKIKGRSKGYRYRNSIVDLQRDLQRANAKKTPQELGEDERFEDDPRALKEIEYGRVVRKSTSGIDDRRRGDY